MMPVFVGARAGAIFSATTDVMHLYAASGELSEVLEVGWGGEATTTTAMRTRFTRATTAGTSPTTNTDNQQLDQQGTAATAKIDSVTTVTSPTYAAGSLFPEQSWNGHGGVVRWLASPDQKITLVGAAAAAHISIRNEVGSLTGSAGWIWRE
jgi:hypothetical protein